MKSTLGLAVLALAAPVAAQESIHTAFSYQAPLDQEIAASSLSIQSAFNYTPVTPLPAVIEQSSLQTAFNYTLLEQEPPVLEQKSLQTAFNYSLSDDEDADKHATNGKSGCGCAGEASCGCEEASCGCEPDCGCEPSCGCNGGCSSGGCSSGGWFGMCDDCIGDAWSIHDEFMPCCDTVIAGWVAVGYHSDLTGLSRQYGDLRDFNDVPGNFNLHQGYLYFEKIADGSDCSLDYGWRFDGMYGTDAQKMQATGNPSATWDQGWDHGIYGWALPQAYAEVAYGDFSVIAGHFITPMGYESVLSPQNFFYSHSLQSFNSEPFTHTGVLSKYKTDGGWTFYNGWTLGWDTGFDQFGGGSNYLGGAGYKPNDDFEVVYLTTIGNLGKRSDSTFGYAHAIYVVAMLSEDWEYGLASDYYNSNGYFDDPSFNVEEIGIANYLYYTVSERIALGGRAEWWKSNSVNGESTSFYEITGGINYWVNANVVIRPEMRYDWAPAEASLGDFQYNRGIFGVDAVITF